MGIFWNRKLKKEKYDLSKSEKVASVEKKNKNTIITPEKISKESFSLYIFKVPKYGYGIKLYLETAYKLKPVGSFVSKGDKLFELIMIKDKGKDKEGCTIEEKETYFIESDEEGYFFYTSKNSIEGNALVGEQLVFKFAIFNQKDFLYQIRFKNTYKYEEDEFTKEKRLSFTKVGVPNDDIKSAFLESPYFSLWENYLMLSLNFCFVLENISGTDFISFLFDPQKFKLKTYDSISFLLENQEIITFEIKGKSSKVNSNRIYKLPIFREDIETLAQKKTLKIRVTFKEDNYFSEFENGYDWYEETEDFQFVVQSMFIDYLRAVEENVTNYKPIFKGLEQPFTIKNEENCSVYLMLDKSNNYYKIGISNYPEYRERTLLSQKPTIELVCSKKYPSRKIAESIEKALHKAFKEKNIRGEWFSLDEKEVEQIKETLS